MLFGSFLFQFLDFLFRRAASKFLLYGFKLLGKQIVSLLLVYVFAYFSLYFHLQLLEIGLLAQCFQDFVGSFGEVVYFQKFLLFRHINIQMRCNVIKKEIRTFYIANGKTRIRRHVGRHLQKFKVTIPQCFGNRLCIMRHILGSIGCRLHLSDPIWLVGYDMFQLEPVQALQNHHCGTIGHVKGFENPCHRSVAIKFCIGRIFDRQNFLGYYTDYLLVFIGCFYQLHGPFPACRYRQDDPRKEHITP